MAVFIYWGWDSTVCVNEETDGLRDDARARPRSPSTIILVGIYVLVSAAAVAFAGPDAIANDDSGDALGLLGADVLGIAAGQDRDHRGADLGGGLDADDDPADRAHLAVDGAREGVARVASARIHPRYLTPHVSTILMGGFSIAWYVGLTLISENILFDSIAALGLMIAFYYGHHRLRVRVLLPPRAVQERQELPAASASRR